MRRTLQRWTVPLLGLLAAACAGDDFDPFNRVNSLRVLGIRSEPVAPEPGQSTTLTPLLFVPEDQSEPRLFWSWCPLPSGSGSGFECLLDEATLSQFAGPLELPPFELGEGGSMGFPHTIPGPVLRALCEGQAGVPALPECMGGFPIQIRLRVETDQDEVIAVRTLRLLLDDTPPPGENPRLEGITVELDGSEQSLGSEPELPRDRETTVRAVLDEGQAEPYTDENGDPQRETLRLTWFVESGSTRTEQTGFRAGVVPFDDFRENEWTPERSEDYPASTARIILVVRDDREGIGWQSGSVRLEREP